MRKILIITSLIIVVFYALGLADLVRSSTTDAVIAFLGGTSLLSMLLYGFHKMSAKREGRGGEEK